MNESTSCRETTVFSIAAHVIHNLFLKICSLFRKILIMRLKISMASFSLSSYSKKMRWGRGCDQLKMLITFTI